MHTTAEDGWKPIYVQEALDEAVYHAAGRTVYHTMRQFDVGRK